MRTLLLATTVSVALAAVGSTAALAARNPSQTGPPSQSCQTIEEEGGRPPGNARNSPGSPFNEAGIDSEEGGIGGQNYTEKSQYDVACYQVSKR
jgi:hypothetical protein